MLRLVGNGPVQLTGEESKEELQVLASLLECDGASLQTMCDRAGAPQSGNAGDKIEALKKSTVFDKVVEALREGAEGVREGAEGVQEPEEEDASSQGDSSQEGVPLIVD